MVYNETSAPRSDRAAVSEPTTGVAEIRKSLEVFLHLKMLCACIIKLKQYIPKKETMELFIPPHKPLT